MNYNSILIKIIEIWLIPEIYLLFTFDRYVTAKAFARRMDNGKSASTIKAKGNNPNATHQDAFITINEITPAFTAFPIIGPTGF